MRVSLGLSGASCGHGLKSRDRIGFALSANVASTPTVTFITARSL